MELEEVEKIVKMYADLVRKPFIGFVELISTCLFPSTWLFQMKHNVEALLALLSIMPKEASQVLLAVQTLIIRNGKTVQY